MIVSEHKLLLFQKQLMIKEPLWIEIQDAIICTVVTDLKKSNNSERYVSNQIWYIIKSMYRWKRWQAGHLNEMQFTNTKKSGHKIVAIEGILANDSEWLPQLHSALGDSNVRIVCLRRVNSQSETRPGWNKRIGESLGWITLDDENRESRGLPFGRPSTNRAVRVSNFCFCSGLYLGNGIWEWDVETKKPSLVMDSISSVNLESSFSSCACWSSPSDGRLAQCWQWCDDMHVKQRNFSLDFWKRRKAHSERRTKKTKKL